MKTIYGLVVIVSFAVMLFGSVSLSLNDIETVNTNLGLSSQNLIDKYQIQYNNLSGYVNITKPTLNLSSNETNEVDPFFREYAEAKKSVNKFGSAIFFIYSIPTLLLISLPFIDIADTALVLINGIIYLLIGFIIIIAVYKAVRGGKVDNE